MSKGCQGSRYNLFLLKFTKCHAIFKTKTAKDWLLNPAERQSETKRLRLTEGEKQKED